MDYGDVFEKLLVTSVILGLFGAVGGVEPAYAVGLPLFGLFSLYTGNVRALGLTLAFSAFSLIMDIVFLGIVGNNVVQVNDALNGASNVAGAGVFGVAMTAINMFVKLGFVGVGYQLFLSWGGMVAAQAPIAPQGAPTSGGPPGAVGGLPAAADAGAGDAYSSMPPSGGTPTGYDVPTGGYSVPASTGYAASPATAAGYAVPDGSGYGGPGTGYGGAPDKAAAGVESYQSG